MRIRAPFLLPGLTVALLAAGCDSEPKLKVEVAKTPTAVPGSIPAAPEAVVAHSPAAGEARMPIVAPGGEGGMSVAWTVPSNWKVEPPANPTRRAQYRVPGPGGDGECVVFYFGPGQGGDPASNAERWAAQFEPVSGMTAAKKTRTLTAGGMNVLVIETAGTYLAGGLMGGPVVRKPDWALLGAVVEGPDANWYFKFTGPRGTVDAQRAAFEGLLRSLKRGA